MKHSKEPWIVQKYGEPANPYIVAVVVDPNYYSSPKFTIARGEPTGGQGWPAINPEDETWEEAAGNARLIAAAPKMLRILSYLKNSQSLNKTQTEEVNKVLNEI